MPQKPDIFLSALEMTPSGGQVYDEFWWLNTDSASLTKSDFTFPSSGTYRLDISGYAAAGAPVLEVLVGGQSMGLMPINSTGIEIFSISIAGITTASVGTWCCGKFIPAGNVTTGGGTGLELRLSNFSGGTNHARIGLIYFTKTTDPAPPVNPPIVPLTFRDPPTTMLVANHFASGVLRGFNLGGNGYNQPIGSDDGAMAAMVATGANIARVFVEFERPSGNTYQFKADQLDRLDVTIQRGVEHGYYVIPCLFLDPALNTDYWGNAARKASIANLWKVLATRYVGNPAVAAYDLINEPRENYNYAEVIRFQCQLIDAIRAIDQQHVILFEAVRDNQFAMMLPVPYDNIVYSPHSYSLLRITHQGVDSDYPCSNKYPATTASCNLPDADHPIPWNKDSLSDTFAEARTMYWRFNVPMCIGEFSCIAWAPLNGSGQWSATQYVIDSVDLFETENWSWFYHAWRGDWENWEAEIPGSFYTAYTPYTNGKPTGLPGYNTVIAARNTNAPTITALKNVFVNNQH
jgi:hypothetical protein